VQQVVVETAKPPFRWIDVTGPSREELEALAQEHGLHPLAVADCLDPTHRPKYERMGKTTFVILRAFDETASAAADTAQKLTRKIALFIRKELLLTIHRAEMRCLLPLKETPAEAACGPSDPPCAPYVLSIVNAVVDSYWEPLDDIETAVSILEDRPLGRKDRLLVLRRTFRLKRRLNALRITARHTVEVVKRFSGSAEEHVPASPFLTDVRENAETLYFATDELLEDVHNLLSLELAAADHETNEVMRVLTVFAAFFLPLTFIVGIYGMNFDLMPELRWPIGYPLVLVFMAAVCVVIYTWFRRRGWL
jgi:magnesium transporter